MNVEEVRAIGEEIKRIGQAEVPTLLKYADANGYLAQTTAALEATATADAAPQHPAADVRLVHHDPEIYPDPYAFRPERFLEEAVAGLVRDQVVPWLKRPVTDMQNGRFAQSRFVSEFCRSFALGLFTFLWFFIVPIPGLLVFTAPGGDRIMMPLSTVLEFAGGVVGVVLAWYGVSLLLERWVRHGITGKGEICQLMISDGAHEDSIW